ncbi:hypothetical protein PTKIN_Ptkin19aG0011400 [Pterospermum kingtungense]
MAKTESDSFDSNIKEGNIYKISDFTVIRSKHSFNTVSAPCTITISRRTKFTELHMVEDKIPLYYFDFTDFEQLQPRTKNNFILTDIIGLVTFVSKITKIYVSNNPEQVPKRNIELKNTRGFTLTVTLWGNCAFYVDDSLIGLKTQPILILTSTTVSEFNGKNIIATSSASKAYLDPDIPMVAEMKAHFQESVEPVAELELYQRPQLSPTEQENINRVNIEQLLAIDHKKFPVWYYNACKICLKTLLEFGPIYWCETANHREQTPFLCYKLLMNAEDDIGRTSFLAFGDVVEKLLGVTVARLTVSGKKDKYVLPEPIQNRFLNQTAVFTVTAIIKGLEHGHLSFRVIACRIMDQAATSNINLSLPPPPKTDSQPEKQINANQPPPSSLTMSQIP